MIILVVGLVLFLSVHLIALTPWRETLIAHLGVRGYKGAVSVVSLVTIAIMAWGFAAMRTDHLAGRIVYQPPEWARHATMGLVFLAFILLGIAVHKGRLRLWIKTPLAIATVLWAGGHLLSNGCLGDVVLFGAFFVYGLFDGIVRQAKGRVELFTPKPSHDYIAPVAGAFMYAIVLFLHPWLFGVTVIDF